MVGAERTGAMAAERPPGLLHPALDGVDVDGLLPGLVALADADLRPWNQEFVLTARSLAADGEADNGPPLVCDVSAGRSADDVLDVSHGGASSTP